MLQISPQLGLPLEAVTETFGILARKRVGKSNSAVVMAEEMYDAGLPWVAIDPKGDWWGLRAAGDGKTPGLPIIVFGGEHGDVPLEPSAGELIADLVVQQRLTCVLDVSEMFIANKAATRRFLTTFARRLYARNRDPLHLFCEEADEYIPQVVRGDDAEMVGAFETLVKRGGFRGVGITLVTQRSASLNKDVLSQVGTLIVLQTTGPNDKKAILGWIQEHELGADVMKEIASLQPGEAWVFSPAWLRTLEKIKFRRRRTFDSGATPKVGVKARPPATLADVDIAALTERMAATIERAKQDDPKELRRQLAERDRRIRELEQQKPAPVAKTVEKRVEVPVLKDQQVARLEAAVSKVWASLEGIQKATAEVAEAINNAKFTQRLTPAPVQRNVPPVVLQSPRTVPRTAPSVITPEDATIGLGERKVLSVLAQWPEGRTQKDLAFLTGYSARASTIGVILSKLRKAGMVEPGQPVRATELGLAQAGGAQELPTGPELLQHWLSHPRIGEGERRVLLALIDAFPEALSHQELCERTNYSPDASTMGVILSKLRKLGLVEPRERRVSASLVEAIR